MRQIVQIRDAGRMIKRVANGGILDAGRAAGAVRATGAEWLGSRPRIGIVEDGFGSLAADSPSTHRRRGPDRSADPR
jgi:hypothetical protein